MSTIAEFSVPGVPRKLVSAYPQDAPVPRKGDITVNRTPYGKPQGVPLPGSEKPGYSAIYRNAHHPEALIDTIHPTILTLYDGFANSVRNHADANCLGHREYVPEYKTWSPYIWESYARVAERRTDFGSGLLKLARDVADVQKTDKFGVAIFSPNRPEWVITDLALHAYNLYGVTLYDSLGPDASEYILNLTEAPILVASLNNIPEILTVKHNLPHLKVIISMDELESPIDTPGNTRRSLLKTWTKVQNVALYSFSEVERIGRDALAPHNPPAPTDIMTINFTSGTTGAPKGVVLTHGTAIAGMTSALLHIETAPKRNDVLLSYLPLAHIYERISLCQAMSFGAAYGFLHGSVLELIDDIKTLRPTVFTSVPRLLNRIEEALRAKTINAPGLAGKISRKALKAKLDDMEHGGTGQIVLWDVLWSRKIRKNAGFDRLTTAVSGSAPISDPTLQFLRAAFACNMIQGYGLTESFAIGLVGEPDDKKPGHCGPPVVGVEVRLKDVPEMNYFSTDKPFPRGELLLRGPIVFQEYYKEPKKTAEAMDEEGWFCTGDVAKIDELGRVSIIDRVKNFFKLAQGEYIAPEQIENIYLAGCDLVSQVFVHGDSIQTFLIGILGINPDTFAPFASKLLNRNIPPSDLHELASAAGDRKVRDAVLRDLDRVAKNANLQGYERVKNIVLKIDPFNFENDLLTPSLKSKRPQSVRYYRDDIDKMYAEGELIKNGNGYAKAML
ncbi:eukaryotic long-chain fatty acid CoA synthetase (LC-FACS) [Lipomyces chichibuensis]|uniref:eukaryotic long-chain fatty acid CoA synthetase (LC-FACS) n=1 Tax=Lipomyces chichibuensis TaxID=1546026 RepID=UPI003342ECC4